MAIRKITDEEIRNLQIQGNLPNRPTQKSLYPDNTKTADEVKAAFDRLPKLIAKRYNELVSAFSSITNGVISVLPDFSEADNGKVLGVKDGESKWIELGISTNGASIVGAVLEKASDDPITFTINGMTHEATSGMTWGEWVYSDYNTIGCEISGTTVMYGDNDPIKFGNAIVSNEAKIEAGASYKSTSYTPPITFTISGTTYGATGGMKWSDWVASAYNTADYVVDNTDKVIRPKNDPSVAVYNGNVAVTENDFIGSGKEYQVLTY